MTSEDDFDDETGDPPWLTKEDDEQIMKERMWLKDTPGESDAEPFRDMIFLYFRPEVLDKYKDDKYCSISSSNISFHGLKGEIILIVDFIRKDGELMVRARDYAFVPPKERGHWEQFRLDKDDNSTL